jgi:hypothetical protein
MSNTFKHKWKGKYQSGVLDYEDDIPPIELEKMWSRHNWDIGESRRQKKLKKIKDLDKDLQDDLENK